MIKHCINEDKKLQNLLVIFSPKIREKIDVIDEYNHNNIESLTKWYEYIEWLAKYISNPVIAWDNTGKYTHFPNGAVYIHELGYEVRFIIRTDYSNHNYVYVFDLNLKPKEFDLNEPDSINEHYLLDVPHKEISKEALYKIMSEQYERYLYSLF